MSLNHFVSMLVVLLGSFLSSLGDIWKVENDEIFQSNMNYTWLIVNCISNSHNSYFADFEDLLQNIQKVAIFGS